MARSTTLRRDASLSIQLCDGIETDGVKELLHSASARLEADVSALVREGSTSDADDGYLASVNIAFNYPTTHGGSECESTSASYTYNFKVSFSRPSEMPDVVEKVKSRVVAKLARFISTRDGFDATRSSYDTVARMISPNAPMSNPWGGYLFGWGGDLLSFKNRFLL